MCVYRYNSAAVALTNVMMEPTQVTLLSAPFLGDVVELGVLSEHALLVSEMSEVSVTLRSNWKPGMNALQSHSATLLAAYAERCIYAGGTSVVCVRVREYGSQRPVVFAAEFDAMTAVPTRAPIPHHSLVELLQADDRLGLLQQLLEVAGVEVVMADGGNYTLFAPTDAAFYAVARGTVEGLMMPENSIYLLRLLQHHLLGKTLYLAADDGLRAAINAATAANRSSHATLLQV